MSTLCSGFFIPQYYEHTNFNFFPLFKMIQSLNTNYSIFNATVLRFQDKLLKKGMVILREFMKNDLGEIFL